MKEQLPEELKKERQEIFYDIQQQITAQLQQNRVGSTAEAICDFFDEEKRSFVCRSENDAPEDDLVIYVPLEYDLIPGEVYELRINGTDGLDLTAVPID